MTHQNAQILAVLTEMKQKQEEFEKSIHEQQKQMKDQVQELLTQRALASKQLVTFPAPPRHKEESSDEELFPSMNFSSRGKSPRSKRQRSKRLATQYSVGTLSTGRAPQHTTLQPSQRPSSSVIPQTAAMNFMEQFFIDKDVEMKEREVIAVLKGEKDEMKYQFRVSLKETPKK
jgi:hypothetical protein